MKLRNVVAKSWKSAYFRIIFWFYGLSMLTSLLNYVFYPVMARLTDEKTYGEIQFLITIIMQLMILFMALNVVTIILSIRYASQGDLLRKKITSLASFFNALILLFTVTAVIGLTLGKDSLHFTSATPFIVLGLTIASTVPFTISVGKLQGEERFIGAGLLGAGGSLLKLFCSILFVLLGMGTTGAVLGIAVGQTLAVAIAILHKDVAFSEIYSISFRQIKHLREDFHLVFLASLGVLVVNVLIALDTFGAKVLLPPHEAGLYAGIATLSKIAVFVVSPLMWLVISSAAQTSIQHAKRVKLIATLSILLCVALFAAYKAAPELVIRLSLGSSFLADKELLSLSTAAMCFLSIAGLFQVILAARNKLYGSLLMVSGMAGVFALTAIVSGVTVHNILLAQANAGIFGVLFYILYIKLQAGERTKYGQKTS